MTGFWSSKKIQILGVEFAGQVESVGKAVTQFGEGDQVFGSTGFKFGAHAEYMCLHQDALLAMKPANMTFEEAAAVLFGGMSFDTVGKSGFLRSLKSLKRGGFYVRVGGSGRLSSILGGWFKKSGPRSLARRKSLAEWQEGPLGMCLFSRS
jgi:NADPH:quinone reductase-like Zn-dependent oxidoreductase